MDLRKLADAAAKEIRRESRKTRSPTAYFLAVHSAEYGARFRLPKDAAWMMNSGDGKVLLFSGFREMRDVAVWVFGSEVWLAKRTPEGAKHSPKEHDAHMDSGFKTLQKMGWATVTEALVIVAQNVEEVVQVTQPFIRKPGSGDIQLCGPPEVQAMAQADFGGRIKMFGDVTEADVQGAYPKDEGDHVQ